MLKSGLPEMPKPDLNSMRVATKIVRNGNYVYPVLQEAKGDEDCYTTALDMVKEGIRDTYLNRCYSCTVPDSVFEVDAPVSIEDIQPIRMSINRSINRISRLQKFDKDSPLEIHITSGKYAAHLTLLDDRRNGSGVIGHLYIADDVLQIVMSGIININQNGSKYVVGDGAFIMYAGTTLFFISKKWRNAEKAAYSHRDVCKFGIMGSFETYLVDYMLTALITEMKNGNPSTNQHYLPIETFMFATVIKDLGLTVEAHTIFTWCHENDVGNELLPNNLADVPSEIFPSTNHPYPQIDFDKKEWNFVSGYCKRNNLLQDHETDLLPYFTNPRYGNTYVMLVNTDTGEKDRLVTTFTLNGNVLRLYISETINEYTAILTLVDFVDIDHYTPNNSLRTLRKCVMYTKFESMFASVEDLVNVSPLLQSGIDNTLALVNTIIQFFVIMRDRPERSRMIKAVKHTEYTHSKSHKTNVSHDEVVWKILKPVKAAKEYIQSMSQGGSRNMEYTLEEWERIGHYRTLKSGKQIWIEPTTCRRRDDLLVKDKDIKIKL